MATAAPRGVVSTHATQYEYQLFPEAYFSGCDVVIYFGDVFVDDISRLQFTLQESVRPIYGYASRTWDVVARGARIVHGSFELAFREAGYLDTILGHIGQMQNKAVPALISSLSKGASAPSEWTAGIQQRIEELLNEKGGGNNNAAQQRLSAMETAIWDRAASPDTGHKHKSYFYNDRYNPEWQLPLLTKGFDIYLTYGAIQQKIQSLGGGSIPTSVDIPYTVKAIRNIQLTSCSQNVDSEGNPISETYQFIAQDLD